MFITTVRWTFASTMLIALGGVELAVAQAQTQPATTQGSGANAAPTSPTEEDFKSTEGEAVIGASDLLTITIKRGDATKTQAVRVDGAGKITLPDIGDVSASGLTPEKLEDAIEEKLADAGQMDAEASLRVLEARSYTFSIFNARNSGIYNLPTRDFKLSEAIEAAGGAKETGGATILVIRKADGRQIEVPVEKVKARDSKFDIVVRPGDRILIRSKDM